MFFPLANYLVLCASEQGYSSCSEQGYINISSCLKTNMKNIKPGTHKIGYLVQFIRGMNVAISEFVRLTGTICIFLFLIKFNIVIFG